MVAAHVAAVHGSGIMHGETSEAADYAGVPHPARASHIPATGRRWKKLPHPGLPSPTCVHPLVRTNTKTRVDKHHLDRPWLSRSALHLQHLSSWRLNDERWQLQFTDRPARFTSVVSALTALDRTRGPIVRALGGICD